MYITKSVNCGVSQKEKLVRLISTVTTLFRLACVSGLLTKTIHSLKTIITHPWDNWLRVIRFQGVLKIIEHRSEAMYSVDRSFNN